MSCLSSTLILLNCSTLLNDEHETVENSEDEKVFLENIKNLSPKKTEASDYLEDARYLIRCIK